MVSGNDADMLPGRADPSRAGWLEPFRIAIGLRAIAWVCCRPDGTGCSLVAASCDTVEGRLGNGSPISSAGGALAAIRAGEPMMMNHDRARDMAVPYSTMPVPVWGAMVYPGADGFLWADRDRDVVDEMDFKVFSSFGRQFFSTPSLHRPTVPTPPGPDSRPLLDAIDGTSRILESETEESCLETLAAALLQLSSSRLVIVVAVDANDGASCQVAAVAGEASPSLTGRPVQLQGTLPGLVMRSQMAAPSDFRCGAANRRVLGPENPVVLELDESLVVLPAAAGREAIGAVVLAGGDYLEPSILHGARTLCNCAGLLVHQFRLRSRISSDAMRDDLTGMLNRRAFGEMYSQVYRSIWRQGSSISLLMIDADRFKLVNDELGHPAGDRVLRFIAEAIMSCLRLSDFAGRFGGEEFVVCLPATDMRGAARVAERIRQVCAGTAVPLDRGSRVVTVSIGVATANASGRQMSGVELDLLKRADEALYRAKAGGRNRVELS